MRSFTRLGTLTDVICVCPELLLEGNTDTLLPSFGSRHYWCPTF